MRSFRFVLLILVFTSTVSCKPQVITTTPQVGPTSIPSPTSTSSPEVSVKIMSYNILFGGGFLPEWYEHVADKKLHRDRTPELFEYLSQLDADVVALQEAYGWDDTTPPFIATAAQEIGLPNYYVAPSASDHDTAILTRYEILEAESLFEELGDPSILRTRLQTPDGNPLNVFVIHLDPFSEAIRLCQLDQLTSAVGPYKQERTILLGDFNFTIKDISGYDSPETVYLEEAGYKLVLQDKTLNRDHLWVPADSAPWKSQPWFERPKTPLSDHSPIGIQFNYFTYDAQAIDTSPQNTQTYTLPDFFGQFVENPKVLTSSSFDDDCTNRQWFPNQTDVPIENGAYILTGKENWSAYVTFPGSIETGQGMLTRIRTTKESEFSIYLSYGGQWGDETYREAGLYFPFEEVKLFETIGSNFVSLPQDISTQIQPEHDYWLAILAGFDGQLKAFIQDAEDPAAQVYAFDFEKMDESSSGVTWTFSIGANSGTITIDEYARYTFDGFK